MSLVYVLGLVLQVAIWFAAVMVIAGPAAAVLFTLYYGHRREQTNLTTHQRRDRRRAHRRHRATARPFVDPYTCRGGIDAADD